MTLPAANASNPIPGLPPISQIGFVVRDMDAALLRYTPLYGPFTCLTYVNQGYDFHGEPADCELRVAYGMSGYIVYGVRKFKGIHTSVISTSTDEPDERGMHR